MSANRLRIQPVSVPQVPFLTASRPHASFAHRNPERILEPARSFWPARQSARVST